MYAVGIDVSKGRSTVAVLEPLGKTVAKPFEVRHTKSGMNDLVNYLNTLGGECRIVLEHTGRYYEPVVRWLSGAGLFVSAVNPKLIKDFVLKTSFNFSILNIYIRLDLLINGMCWRKIRFVP